MTATAAWNGLRGRVRRQASAKPASEPGAGSPVARPSSSEVARSVSSVSASTRSSTTAAAAASSNAAAAATRSPDRATEAAISVAAHVPLNAGPGKRAHRHLARGARSRRRATARDPPRWRPPVPGRAPPSVRASGGATTTTPSSTFVIRSRSAATRPLAAATRPRRRWRSSVRRRRRPGSRRGCRAPGRPRRPS